ncbi:MAG: hypothetical protein CBD13_001230 [Candidatus Pelagibacter sp. TMED153]|nr:MAG: hypothetical protein CBD13_001230 [Candidatus Pelagibacter sp. TMED153]|tara:strand:- start:1182 stop:1685 length:504 start_codon:yes stop_codon:yes gene_type:complete
MLEIKKIKKLSHLSFSIKKFLKYYPWKNCNPKKSNNLTKELNSCNIAIVSSAGLVVNQIQKPFNHNIKFGDWSYRVIPKNIEANELKEYQKSNSFDHSGVKEDPFSVLPIPHLVDLENEGFIGSVNKRHISLMGATINTSKLINQTIPNIIEIFKEDDVDIVIFIPV